MESPITSTQPAASSPGTLKPNLSPSALMTPPRDKSHTPPTISPNSVPGFKSGEESSSTGPAKPLVPSAEDLLAAAPQLQPRTLTVTSEEFYQWQQILGAYKQQVKSNLRHHYDGTQ